MKWPISLCVSCSFVMGCGGSPPTVDEVDKHPLLQRPAVTEVRAQDPVPKSPTPAPIPAKKTEPKKPLTLDEAVANASDPAGDTWKRQEAVQAVHRMNAEDRIKGLRRIAEAPVYEIAASAAGHLIKAGAPDAVSVARRRITDWSAHEQLIVLGAVRETALTLDAANKELREISRLALAQLLHEGAAGKERGNGEQQKAAVVDVCAMILGTNAEPGDKHLLQKAAQRYPQRIYLWLVLGRLDGITDQERPIAQKTYQDDKLPILVRAAVATALSGRDAEAAAFAEKQIRGHLARYGNRYSEDDIKSFGKLATPAERDQMMREMKDYMQEKDLVMMLRFLETPAAEALTFEGYQCKNLHTRTTAAVVAASRWPKRFLDGGQGQLSRNDYANLLALIDHKQPQLREQVLQKITEKELEGARARLRQRTSSPSGIATDELIFLFF